jgi:regulator of sigma E protease
VGSILWSAITFIVTLGVLVSFHELGHYWVARRLGVKVLRFSVGFGKPLWKRRYGVDQTEYALAAIPLGGYVKMLDEREAEVPDNELHRAFNRQPVGKRMAIVVAGPVFNFILAIAAYWLMYLVGVPGIKPVVGDVAPASIAAQAGFQNGDQIIRIDHQSTPTWEVVRLELLDAALDGKPVEIVVTDQAARERVIQIDLSLVHDGLKEGNLLEEMGIAPHRPQVAAVIGELESNGPAAQAGLRESDLLISVNNTPIKDWAAWVEYVQNHPEQRLLVEIKRNGTSDIVELTPARVNAQGREIGRIGAAPYISEGRWRSFAPSSSWAHWMQSALRWPKPGRCRN